jgi:hypothetical protein
MNTPNVILLVVTPYNLVGRFERYPGGSTFRVWVYISQTTPRVEGIVRAFAELGYQEYLEAQTKCQVRAV